MAEIVTLRRRPPAQRWDPLNPVGDTPGPWTDGDNLKVQMSNLYPEWLNARGEGVTPYFPDDGVDYCFGEIGFSVAERTNGSTNDPNTAHGTSLSASWSLIPRIGQLDATTLSWRRVGYSNRFAYRRGLTDNPDIWENAFVRECVANHASNLRTGSFTSVNSYSGCPALTDASGIVMSSTNQGTGGEAMSPFDRTGYRAYGVFDPQQSQYRVENFNSGIMMMLAPFVTKMPLSGFVPGYGFAVAVEIDGWGDIYDCMATAFIHEEVDGTESVPFSFYTNSNVKILGGTVTGEPGLLAQRALGGTVTNTPNPDPIQARQVSTQVIPPPTAVHWGATASGHPDPLAATSTVTAGRAVTSASLGTIPNDPLAGYPTPELHSAGVGYAITMNIRTPRWRFWFQSDQTPEAPIRQVVDEPVRSLDPTEVYAAAGPKGSRASFEPRPM